MAVYSLDFSERCIDAAEALSKQKTPKKETDRAILYLSLVSCEISLKALLEKAGFPVKQLTKHSHSFPKLLKDLCECKFKTKKGSGAKLLSKTPDPSIPQNTVGMLLDFEAQTGSKYPTSIRYGETIKHFPPLLMLRCAIKVHEWAKKNFNEIKKK